jgi:hypothetical protein
VQCSYCSGALRQPGRPDRPLQIHFPSLFFLFHRTYLYFFERIIAAKLLVGDPGFALLFWSWNDVPGCPTRSRTGHRRCTTRGGTRGTGRAQGSCDLEFMEEEKNYTHEQHIQGNLWVMQKQVPTHSRHSRLSK